MKFDELLKKAGVSALAKSEDGHGVEIAGIHADTRTLSAGSLYVALPGSKAHGDTFIGEAIGRGAVAVVSENRQSNCPVPWAQVADVRTALGMLAKTLWQIPVDQVMTVGITGTNGKTTTAHLFKKLFEEHYTTDAVWMFGTINYQLGGRVIEAPNTTPQSIEIFRHMAQSADLPKALVMEVSSHGLSQDRIAGIPFTVAVFTNLTQDHLDFHRSMENYYQAKKKLFSEYLRKGGHGVVNIDDPWGKRLVLELGNASWVTFGKSPEATIRILGWQCDWDGTTIDILIGEHTVSFHCALRGFFNVYNMAGLVAGAWAIGIDAPAIARAFSAVETVPGRMDRVCTRAPCAVIVDYAHTPDALINILQTSRSLTTGKLICVFGCGGDRDRTKRPIMGAAVANNCDEAIVTSDNPRSEQPQAIIGEILAGMPLDFPHWVIADRKSAIRKALQLGGPGDCIVIAGKGHETYQEIMGVKLHFSDREVAEEVCNELEA